MTEFVHETVLLKETVDALELNPAGIYVDCTLGGAGHSRYLLNQLTTGHLYAFDQDQHAIDHALEFLKEEVKEGKVTFIKNNFRNLKEALGELGVSKVDGIIYDLGVSSPQLDEASRGLRFKSRWHYL